ncbi:MAG: hypothetical protein AB8G23_16425 [Myxococcota bacterium]
MLFNHRSRALRIILQRGFCALILTLFAGSSAEGADEAANRAIDSNEINQRLYQTLEAQGDPRPRTDSRTADDPTGLETVAGQLYLSEGNLNARSVDAALKTMLSAARVQDETIAIRAAIELRDPLPKEYS